MRVGVPSGCGSVPGAEGRRAPTTHNDRTAPGRDQRAEHVERGGIGEVQVVDQKDRRAESIQDVRQASEHRRDFEVDGRRRSHPRCTGEPAEKSTDSEHRMTEVGRLACEVVRVVICRQDAVTLGDFGEQPRLADPGGAFDHDELVVADAGALDRLLDRGHRVIASDERQLILEVAGREVEHGDDRARDAL